jgi:hypothetical protein
LKVSVCVIGASSLDCSDTYRTLDFLFKALPLEIADRGFISGHPITEQITGIAERLRSFGLGVKIGG